MTIFLIFFGKIKKIDLIFNATIKLCGKIGLVGLTMNKIAKEAGLAIGTLYLYFDSKETLMNELYAHLKKDSLKMIPKNDRSLKLKQRMFILWEILIEYRINNVEELVFLEQYSISPFMTEDAKKIANEFNSHIFKLIAERKKNNLIKDIDNILIFPVLSGYIREFCLILKSNNIIPNRDLTRKSFEVCWSAIKK